MTDDGLRQQATHELIKGMVALWRLTPTEQDARIVVDGVLGAVDRDARKLIETLRAENKRLTDALSRKQAQKYVDDDCIDRQTETIEEQREDIGRLTEQREALVDASLTGGDYTVDHDCGTAVDDPNAYQVALANIHEMHRVLGVRLKRLLAADEERDRLTEERDESRQSTANLARKRIELFKRLVERDRTFARLNGKLREVRQLAAQWEENAARFRTLPNIGNRDLGKLMILTRHAQALRDALGDSDVTDQGDSVQSEPENERCGPHCRRPNLCLQPEHRGGKHDG